MAHAYLDQLARGRGLPEERLSQLRAELDRLERPPAGPERSAALAQLAASLEAEAASAGDAARVRALSSVIAELARG